MEKVKYYICWGICAAAGIAAFISFCSKTTGLIGTILGIDFFPANIEMWIEIVGAVIFAIAAIKVRFDARCPSCGTTWGLEESGRVAIGTKTKKGSDGKYYDVTVYNVTYTCVECGHSLTRVKER